MRRSFSGRASVAESAAFPILAGLVLCLLVTRRYMAFVTPLLMPVLGFMAVVFILWGIVGLRQSVASYRRVYTNAAGLFIAALLLVGPAVFGIVPVVFQAAAQHDDGEGEARPFGMDLESVDGDGIDTAHKRIILNTKNWYKTIFKLTKHNEEYVGYEVYMTGFVSYHDDSLNGNDFTPSRYLMLCCVNDMSPFGIACRVRGDTHYPEFTWLAVKGKLETGDYHGMARPVLVVEDVRRARKVDGYVYPY